MHDQVNPKTIPPQYRYLTRVNNGEPGNEEVFFAVPPVVQARARSIQDLFNKDKGFVFGQLCKLAGQGARLSRTQRLTLEDLIKDYYWGVKI